MMVYGVGETVLDIVFKDNQPRQAIPGGSVFNSLISLGRAGIPCAFIGEVGDDHVGELTRAYLRDNGVSDRYVRTNAGMKSHISLAFLNRANDAEYSFYKDHNAWGALSDLPDIRTEDVLLIGSYYAINPITHPTVTALLDKAVAAGATIYYDVNFRRAHIKDLELTRANIEQNIRVATIVRASHEDIEMIGFTPDHHNLIITRGEDTISYHGHDYPVAKIETVSTVGAGDTFNAGFIAAYASGWDDATCVAQGMKWAQEVCQSYENAIKRI